MSQSAQAIFNDYKTNSTSISPDRFSRVPGRLRKADSRPATGDIYPNGCFTDIRFHINIKTCHHYYISITNTANYLHDHA